jgi:hypothetical protein
MAVLRKGASMPPTTASILPSTIAAYALASGMSTISTVRFSASNSLRASATTSGATPSLRSGIATRTVARRGRGSAAGEPEAQRATGLPMLRSPGSVADSRPQPSLTWLGA